MKTQKFTKTLAATAILSCAFLAESVRAENVLPCGDNESDCWKCGNNCYARLNSDMMQTANCVMQKEQTARIIITILRAI